MKYRWSGIEMCFWVAAVNKKKFHGEVNIPRWYI